MQVCFACLDQGSSLNKQMVQIGMGYSGLWQGSVEDTKLPSIEVVICSPFVIAF